MKVNDVWNILSNKDMIVVESTSAKEIKRLSELKRGSRDEDVPDHWTNALELAQWAYEKSNIERPEPFMRNAWNQYNDILAHAVKMLARFRGIKGAWRLSQINK